ncbi:MAG: hypothetical protein DIZ80_01765 [endosymbiont of Galathealinum brachiosum]|uniref:Chemotaxis methyl-accepting receptor HlyB-like 4HB MCP domain-containing protein n=1 Tax=endosymbiont of Galathealinum brachiosum TaxID=2200906 RepID=A0A370DL95_9GAMM|nr:MAG: hypothetical protein DIZ80_01765 [endosymbiont of Galathealinum brachiosum]
MELEHKLKLFYITSIFSMLFAVLGFSYNAWRMELTEDNNNIRTASFEVLTQLSEMEQVIYAAHYDKNMVDGSPRKAWVKVGLIVDLSSLISPHVERDSNDLKTLWSESWQMVKDDETATQNLVMQIDKIRDSIKLALGDLQ